MEASNLLRDLKRHVGELAALHEVGKALTSSLELSEVLQLIMQKVGELLQPKHYSLMLMDDAGGLKFEIAAGSGEAALPGKTLAPGEGLAGAAAVSGVPVLVEDVRQDPRFSPRMDQALGFETRSVLALPLRARERTLGVIELVNGPDGRAFTEDDVATLRALGDYAAIAVENARNFHRVQELTVIDEHTGLYNARHLKAMLEAEVRRANRFRHPVSLVFIDVDHFKHVNDGHGHMVGSSVLKELGQRLRQHLRSTDVPTRYGGDEFAVILPETDPEAAVRAAERWRAALTETPFAQEHGLALRITGSFGVATMPDHALNAEELLRAADAAMYRAKAAGRDRVIRYESPLQGAIAAAK
ncbi:MAG: sensor domain-containing diguanylate cyclase [Deltaproteobacteria bacterium]|nr:sensor domain-containing diguanylate cyclase [Deltaproteobacteria bacterium]